MAFTHTTLDRTNDPYRNFKFRIRGDSAWIVYAGCSDIDGLEKAVEAIKYREGGDTNIERKLMGRATVGDVTLKRGLTSNTEFRAWLSAAADESTAENSARMTLIIELGNKQNLVVKEWKLVNAWPNKRGLEGLKAMGNEVLFEQIVVSCEDIEEINTPVTI